MYFKLLVILLLSYYLEKPLHDSICRNFIGLMWLDWIGLEWTWFYWIGLECGLFWIAFHSNGQHRTTLNRTSLDSLGLHWARNYAPDWNTLHCTSVGGTGLDWTGMDYCTWLLWTWDVPDGNTLQSTCVDWTSLEWTGLDCREGHKTGLDYTALHFTALDCYRLCLTALQSHYFLD